MTSLSEAYGDVPGTDVSLSRLYLGIGLFLGGSALLALGIVVAGTNWVVPAGDVPGTARLYGGVLGGLGVPAVVLGAFTVLPSGRATKAAAVVGAAVSVLGVGLFWHAYPCQWIGTTCADAGPILTLPTAALYSFGMLTAFWCLFAGIANFKTRNDPGGTVTMELVRRGETKVIEVERGLSGLGGIGFLGSTPEPEVETSAAPTPSPATSDGGTGAEVIESPLDDGGGGDGVDTAGASGREAERAGRSDSRPAPGERASLANRDPGSDVQDTYCGSCRHFEYVQTNAGMQPYCGFHDELMDDMEACEEWTPRD